MKLLREKLFITGKDLQERIEQLEETEVVVDGDARSGRCC